ncbi:MAG: hypothetical protein WC241_02775 [Candidatus Paceibacterota bacterium]
MQARNYYARLTAKYKLIFLLNLKNKKMATENQLDERLRNLPTGALLDVFASESTPEEVKHQIRVFIVEEIQQLKKAKIMGFNPL